VNGVAVNRLSGQRGRGLPALNTGGLGLEVEHEIGLAVVIHILDVSLLVRLLRALGAEADAQGINGGGIEGVGGQDSYRGY
jgi:hypothetical protein